LQEYRLHSGTISRREKRREYDSFDICRHLNKTKSTPTGCKASPTSPNKFIETKATPPSNESTSSIITSSGTPPLNESSKVTRRQVKRMIQVAEKDVLEAELNLLNKKQKLMELQELKEACERCVGSSGI
jgi:hypothetical protein